MIGASVKVTVSCFPEIKLLSCKFYTTLMFLDKNSGGLSCGQMPPFSSLGGSQPSKEVIFAYSDHNVYLRWPTEHV